jgi:hypothetical protein
MTQHTALRSDPMDATTQAEAAPAALAVTIVHGTFPRGLRLQLRRNLLALWTRLRGRPIDEAVMWPAPVSQPDRRCWFESGSEFERDLVRRSGLPPGSVVFDHFLWSGRNRFADRAEAARSLRGALRESGRKHPGVPHVVLAHSHGGTVAVKALDMRDESRGGGETPDMRALLTLGTPFVRLVWRWGPLLEVGGLPQFVAIVLPPLVLLLAPLMALYLGRRSDGVAQIVAASGLGIAALVAALRVSLSAATIIIAIILAFGGAALREQAIDAVKWLVIIGIVGHSIALIVISRMRVLREAMQRYVEDEPLCLPCPLLALRAPRDEASLAIGLGQVAQGLGYAAARLVGLLGRPLDRQLAEVGWGAFPFVLFAAMFLLVLVGGQFDWFWTAPALKEVGWLQWGKAHFFVALDLSVVVGMWALLAWAMPTMGISLATGREAFMLPAVTVVEAEPLPNARASDDLRPAEMALEILYDAQPAGLNHSLYDAPEVRDRIAIWLGERAGARR